MKTSGSALDFNNLSDIELERLYLGEWEHMNDEFHPRTCKNCGKPLEKYGKHYSENGGVYYNGWGAIFHHVSPDYNLCFRCYSTKNNKR